MNAARWTAGTLLAAVLLALIGLAYTGHAQPDTTITYRFSFPEPEHHWTQVELTFRALPASPLELRMSRSSPGRYGVHDFAKNVYDVEAHDADGHALTLTRPDPHGWTIPTHSGTVVVRYKVFGDRVDGTYLAIDTTHVHMNMPAAVMWARGFEEHPVELSFEPPRGTSWTAATQLHASDSPYRFTAPNLQYLLDSPIELGPLSVSQFSVDGHTFRFAAHHQDTEPDLRAFVSDVEKIVRVEREVFGEYPSYESGNYTFIADYLPYARSDGMEHRNSTVLTSPASIVERRSSLLNTVAHEFFHAWNVERIRPRSLEPFDFERANMSGELWFAEGFTHYYAPLALSRAGIEPLPGTLATFGDFVRTIALEPGRQVRSAVDMSRMAPFTDLGQVADRTNWSNTFISYYPYGAALGLALDLSLRTHSGGRITLDTYMRAMWQSYGKPNSSRAGYVDRPYTLEDAESVLAEVSGDRAFAREFFSKYVHGRELPDYTQLFDAAGIVVRVSAPGRAWWGNVQLEMRGGIRVVSTPASNSPAYKAGLDAGDEVQSIDGVEVVSVETIADIIGRHRPGDVISVMYVDRSADRKTTEVTLAEDPSFELVALESIGGTLTEAQRAFRRDWLGLSTGL
jgi:predicted metalloprotease with PDZ domain